MHLFFIVLGASEVSTNLYCNSRTTVLGRLRDYLRLLMKRSVGQGGELEAEVGEYSARTVHRESYAGHFADPNFLLIIRFFC